MRDSIEFAGGDSLWRESRGRGAPRELPCGRLQEKGNKIIIIVVIVAREIIKKREAQIHTAEGGKYLVCRNVLKLVRFWPALCPIRASLLAVGAAD